MDDYYMTLDRIDEQLFQLYIEYRKKRDQLTEDFYAGVNMLMTNYRDVIDLEMDIRSKEKDNNGK